MLDKQIRYLKAAQNKDSLFYLASKNSTLNKFKLQKIPNNKHWLVKEDKYWTYILFNPQTLPNQGWKIHLSTQLTESQALLDKVSEYLISKKVSFKFVPSYDALLLKNSKYANRSESGKFITIYPKSNSEFSKLLPALKDLTSSFSRGPYILSDMCWQESNVYFRYGGFKAIYTKNKTGELVPAIYTPTGNLVEDRRLPYYNQPSFISDLPIFLENTFPPIQAFQPIKKYDVQGALHFSNAGGVYVCKEKSTGKLYLLKEGRHGAGLDAQLKDGFSRIKHEAKTLKKLTSTKYVVNLHDHFTSWQHHYLVEDFINGSTLEDLLPKKFPFIPDSQKAQEYATWAKDILLQLQDALTEIHAHNIAMGDLSLSNIMIDKNDSLHLIDFETAKNTYTPYNPGLTTFGFISPKIKTFEESDWFALMRIAYYLFLPIESVKDIAPSILKKQETWISNYFGKNILKFLHSFKKNLPSNLENSPIFLSHYLQVPTHDLTLSTLSLFKKGLLSGIINNLNYSSPHPIPNSLNKNIDHYNFENGISGILWVLYNENAISPRLYKWIDKNKDTIFSTIISSANLGLLNGASGISSVFKKIGYDTFSIRIHSYIKENLNLKQSDISIRSGLAGIGLYMLAKNELNIATKIISELKLRWQKLDFQSFFNEDVGLLTGWSGVSLLAWKLNDKDFALAIIDKIISAHMDKNNNYLLSDNSRGFIRLIPYLEDGNAGLSLLLHKFIREDKSIKKKYSNIFSQLISSNYNYSTYQASVIAGYSGLLPIAIFQAKDHDNSLLNYTLKGLNNFLVKESDNIFVPGNFGYKIELGYSSGNAGILGMLDLLNDDRDEFSWLPLKESIKYESIT